MVSRVVLASLRSSLTLIFCSACRKKDKIKYVQCAHCNRDGCCAWKRKHQPRSGDEIEEARGVSGRSEHTFCCLYIFFTYFRDSALLTRGKSVVRPINPSGHRLCTYQFEVRGNRTLCTVEQMLGI